MIIVMLQLFPKVFVALVETSTLNNDHQNSKKTATTDSRLGTFLLENRCPRLAFITQLSRELFLKDKSKKIKQADTFRTLRSENIKQVVTMSTLLSDFVSKVQTKHWKNLQRRTQKLEKAEQENLLEYLEDHLAVAGGNSAQKESDVAKNGGSNKQPDTETIEAESSSDDDDEFSEEDYELLQRDLDKANARLEDLESNHDFLKTRLETYRSKIQSAEEFVEANSNSGNGESGVSVSKERLEAMTEKIEAYKKALQPIEATYASLSSELESHQLKIESMQSRQMELKLKTQECQVVMEELSYTLGTTPFGEEEIVAQIEEESNLNDDGQDDQNQIDSKDEDVEVAGTSESENA